MSIEPNTLVESYRDDRAVRYGLFDRRKSCRGWPFVATAFTVLARILFEFHHICLVHRSPRSLHFSGRPLPLARCNVMVPWLRLREGRCFCVYVLL